MASHNPLITMKSCSLVNPIVMQIQSQYFTCTARSLKGKYCRSLGFWAAHTTHELVSGMLLLDWSKAGTLCDQLPSLDWQAEDTSRLTFGTSFQPSLVPFLQSHSHSSKSGQSQTSNNYGVNLLPLGMLTISHQLSASENPELTWILMKELYKFLVLIDISTCFS